MATEEQNSVLYTNDKTLLPVKHNIYVSQALYKTLHTKRISFEKLLG